MKQTKDSDERSEEHSRVKRGNESKPTSEPHKNPRTSKTPSGPLQNQILREGDGDNDPEPMGFQLSAPLVHHDSLERSPNLLWTGRRTHQTPQECPTDPTDGVWIPQRPSRPSWTTFCSLLPRTITSDLQEPFDPSFSYAPSLREISFSSR